MNAESKCLIPLGWKRKTTLISAPAYSQKRVISNSQFLCISLLLLCTLSGCTSKEEKTSSTARSVLRSRPLCEKTSTFSRSG